VVTIPGGAPVTLPLVAETAVAKGGFATRMTTAFGRLSQRAMALAGS
jgi:serine-type D-Ala-D-Ala carboxypeptidase (penicillin-binding protein 5/6)